MLYDISQSHYREAVVKTLFGRWVKVSIIFPFGRLYVVNVPTGFAAFTRITTSEPFLERGQLRDLSDAICWTVPRQYY